MSSDRIMAEEPIEKKITRILIHKNMSVTTAESCTGGLVAGTLVNADGLSEVFKEGYITYSNEAKNKLLGVSEETLATYGAVSRQTAAEMAEGAARAAGADASVQAELLTEISGLLAETKKALEALKVVADQAAAMEEGKDQARFYHFDVVPAMEALRTPVDTLEMIVDKEAWPMPSYGDLIFEV